MTDTHESQFPHLREVLDPRFQHLSDAELEASFESAFGEGVTPAEYEDFFRDLGRAVTRIAPVAASFGRGALQGAAAGSALGPWGALGGALVGGTGSALQQHGRGAARDVGGAVSGVVGTAGALTGRGALASGLAGLGRGGAAASLGAVMRRPELLAAVQQLARGRNPSVPLGPAAAAPASHLLGLLGALAREAEAEAASQESTATLPAYLLDAQGRPAVDPSSDDQRAARLLQVLASVAAHEAADRHSDEGFDEAFDEAFEVDAPDVAVLLS